MLTESGQNIDEGPESPEALNLITAVFAHPIHGRLVERFLLMVTPNISLEGVRYVLSWRDGGVAFYRPITIH
ncbi:MAG: hypothetical protein FJ121_13040 [Deltaproteobacteria bacterium]|nr:hypothetical protein [Deltaproteobacteria bacterium]